jgi:hypothetical protein
MKVDKEYCRIRSKELKYLTGYLHSQNPDGSFNVCFNLNTVNPLSRHLHRYEKSYLDEFYTLDGVIKWQLD